MKGLQLGAVALALAGVVSACSTPPQQTTQPSVVTSTSYVTVDSSPAPAPTSPLEPAPADALSPEESLRTVADGVAATYGGSVGIAVVGAEATYVAGDDTAYPAWSTSKVPLVVAATRVAPEAAAGYAPAAIQMSDNGSAEAIWAAVSPADVNQVFAETGVDAVVNKDRTRPEFSAFGQTLLSASQEATLASHLACIDGGAQVLDLMAGITPEQAYGLGNLPGARLKGGWGPSLSGGYQIRQLARVSNSSGQDVAIAITVIPAAGDYPTGQAMASEVAEQLRPLIDTLPTAVC